MKGKPKCDCCKKRIAVYEVLGENSWVHSCKTCLPILRKHKNYRGYSKICEKDGDAVQMLDYKPDPMDGPGIRMSVKEFNEFRKKLETCSEKEAEKIAEKLQGELASQRRKNKIKAN